MEEVKLELGHLDIVINAAGIANELDPQKVIDVNFVRRCSFKFLFNSKIISLNDISGRNCQLYVDWYRLNAERFERRITQ